MADDTDQILIRAYVRNRCESSFGELVHRHVDLVHSTALRIVRDTNLAEDVTQRVFLALAQHSAKLQERLSLTGWHHETARNLAIDRKSTRLNSSHSQISYAVFCLKKKKLKPDCAFPFFGIISITFLRAILTTPSTCSMISPCLLTLYFSAKLSSGKIGYSSFPVPI